MKKYIAYGSNMNKRQMQFRCPDAKIVGIGEMENYRINFRGRGHANIEAFEGMRLPVLVWLITKKCERSLDLYEDYPAYYIKKNIDLRVAGEEISGMVYIMNTEEGDNLAEPTEKYFMTILEGYKENGLDTRILKEALSRNKEENKRGEDQK